MEPDEFGFDVAIDLLKDGDMLCRAGWNGNGMHCVVQEPDEDSLMTHPYLVMVIPDCEEGTRRLPWQPAQVDIFAEDWTRFE